MSKKEIGVWIRALIAVIDQVTPYSEGHKFFAGWAIRLILEQ